MTNNNFHHITGNLLDLTIDEAQIIAHQCACDIKNELGKGLAKDIHEKYPYSNVYIANEERKMGTIVLSGKNSEGRRLVLSMFAQRSKDTISQRNKAFKKCLDKISKIKNLKSIAFPFRIGCGKSTDWNGYVIMLKMFADANPHTSVFIVKQKRPNIVKVPDLYEIETKNNKKTIENPINLPSIKQSEVSENIVKNVPDYDEEKPEYRDFEFYKWVWDELEEYPIINRDFLLKKYKDHINACAENLPIHKAKSKQSVNQPDDNAFKRIEKIVKEVEHNLRIIK